MKQKGIISFGVAPNRQNPFAGAFHDAIFNTWRRFSSKVLYWGPTFAAGYYIVEWAAERYVFELGSWRISGSITDRLTATSTLTPRPAAPSSAARSKALIGAMKTKYGYPRRRVGSMC